MHISWHEVGQFVSANRGWITLNGGLLITSAVKVMPQPGQHTTLYTFSFDWLHQFFNLPNLRLTPGPVYTPPESTNNPPKGQ